jgi:hypothetical protein
MSKSEITLSQAKRLIQSKRYDEARKLLKSMGKHPTAQRWLAKLDEIAPAAQSKHTKVQANQGNRRQYMLWVALAVSAVVVIAVAAFVLGSVLRSGGGSDVNADSANVQENTVTPETEWLSDADVDLRRYAKLTSRQHAEIRNICYNRYPAGENETELERHNRGVLYARCLVELADEYPLDLSEYSQ